MSKKIFLFFFLFSLNLFFGCSLNKKTSHSEDTSTDTQISNYDPETEAFLRELDRTTYVDLSLINGAQYKEYQYFSNYNDSIKFAANISSINNKNKLTGTVTFFFDCLHLPSDRHTTSIDNCTNLPLDSYSNSANCTINNLNASFHSIKAEYSGDENHSSSHSSGLMIEVNPISFGGELVLNSTNFSKFLDPIAFTISFTSEKKPIGIVRIYEHKQSKDGTYYEDPICYTELDGEASITCTTDEYSRLSLSEHQIFARFFPNDKNYLNLDSNTIVHVVNPPT